MRGQFFFILVIIISFIAHPVQSASDIHIAARNGQAIYDSKISYSPKDKHSWSIIEVQNQSVETDYTSYKFEHSIHNNNYHDYI